MMNSKKELVRKGAHTGIAVVFILLAGYVSKEVLIGAGFVLFLLFALIRLSHFSTCMHSVPRVTFGELFFALGIVATAYLALPNVPLFQLSMLVLALADPLAALFGMKFGTHIYTVFDEKRSLEGSFVCFLVALVILISFETPVWVSLVVALLLALVEAFSLRGSDNLFLPTGTVLLLQSFVL